jgi:uncharacterized protein YkwD
MKFLRNVISLLIALLLGFWLASADILAGTQAGEVVEDLVSYLPDRNDLERWNILEPVIVEETTDAPTNEQESAGPTTEISENGAVNYAVVETTIIDLVNELRQEQGVQTVESNEMLKAAANIRAEETAEVFSHTRPDGSDAFTVFEEEGISYPYRTVGENLGMATYHLDEEGMAEFIFNGLVDSEGHYENMIRPDFEEIGVGVHYDGENLYATQLFGTQR